MRNAAAILIGCLVLGGYEASYAFAGSAPSKFIVFFSDRSTELPDVGKTIVKTAATCIEQTHPASVRIAAGAKPGGNMELSKPRFAAVRRALIDEGVSQKLIARAPIAGPKLVGAGTADDRVEISLFSTIGASSASSCAQPRSGTQYRNRVSET
jgi:hypothetical protein